MGGSTEAGSCMPAGKGSSEMGWPRAEAQRQALACLQGKGIPRWVGHGQKHRGRLLHACRERYSEMGWPRVEAQRRAAARLQGQFVPKRSGHGQKHRGELLHACRESVSQTHAWTCGRTNGWRGQCADIGWMGGR
eukprot:360474-Chlamydomonas_euryale.AAC.4